MAAESIVGQSGRFLTVKSPLGADVLILLGFEGTEALSRPFSYRLEMISADDAIKPEDLLGKSVTVGVGIDSEQTRLFNGIVKQIAPGGYYSRGYRTYYAELVPLFWLLTRTADCRIFQNKSAPEIIEQILKDVGITTYELNLQGTYGKREYCVQYRETDFAFVSRLMEEEGIFYFFTHKDGEHTMVIADKRTVWYDAPEGEVEFRSQGEMTRNVSQWIPRFEFRSGKWAQQDYNFETPATSLQTQSPTMLKVAEFKKWEIYDYPGLYKVKADGTTLTKTRMEEEEASYHEVDGQSDCRGFSPGAKFTLSRHDFANEQGRSYAVHSVQHSASDHTQFARGTEATYSNRFTCIPAEVDWRPPRITPRPVVRGPQTAVVVGPAGEEIYCDKYGRIKVQFHWDREGKKDDVSSCWMRVGQLLAGANWGGIFTPRIGMEVIVDFLEGDPDRPIVTGTVYNAQNMPPYALPANKTQSGIKTRSSTKGGTDNFNELRFEDKKGNEDIYFHAEKDFHRVVEHDDDLKVGHDQTRKVGNDQKVDIDNSRTVTINKADDKLTLTKGNRVEEIQTGNDTLKIAKGDRKTEISMGSETLKIGMGDRKTELSMGSDTLTISLGNQTTKLALGKSATEAMQGIELKVGQSSIKIDQMGVTISGMMIKIDGQISTDVKGLMTKIDAGAMLMVKGPITMIN